MLLYAFVILFNFSILLNVCIYSIYRVLTNTLLQGGSQHIGNITLLVLKCAVVLGPPELILHNPVNPGEWRHPEVGHHLPSDLFPFPICIQASIPISVVGMLHLHGKSSEHTIVDINACYAPLQNAFCQPPVTTSSTIRLCHWPYSWWTSAQKKYVYTIYPRTESQSMWLRHSNKAFLSIYLPCCF